MKIYITADIRGTCGIVDISQLAPDSTFLNDARTQFSREVAAVCKAALESEAEEIYVNDCYGDGLNIKPDYLPDEVFLIRGRKTPELGLALLDKTFDGLILLGIHSKTGTNNGVMPSTGTSRASFEIFGQAIGEFDAVSFIAGEMKVPTIMISGDSRAVEQACTNLPSIPTVITKYSLSTGSAMCIQAEKVCDQLYEDTKRAIKNIESVEPPQITGPIQCGVKLVNVLDSDLISWIPGLKRKDDLSFEFTAETMREAANLMYGISMILNRCSL